MITATLKRTFAALLLLILMAAYVGQKVHIYTEDPLHFVALCGDLLPDNGADCGVAERCIVDDYYFFPSIEHILPVHEFYAQVLAVLQPQTTSCKCCDAWHHVPLRAPPVA